MITIGSGNLGMKLATSFTDKPILISTAEQDTVNYEQYDVRTFTSDGAGKRFGTGTKIWTRNRDRLKNVLEDIVNERVVIFSSLGGGSGSSSLPHLAEILLEQGNKVLICGVLPYKKEINPPLANAVQSLNSLLPYITDLSVILFNNETLLKKFEDDWKKINSFIVKRVSYVVNLIDDYSFNLYSPQTIDRSELDSVVFGGGFLDISDNFLEETQPKFEYGKIDKETKNLLIAMFVDKDVAKEKVDDYQSILTTTANKFSSKARNARFVTGIIRGDIRRSRAKDFVKDRAYITIASGLGIDKYIAQVEKMRDEAMEKASHYLEKTKAGKVVGKKETNVLDI